MSSTKPEVHNVSQRRRKRSSQGHRQHGQKLVKIAHVIPEISSRTDRQTDRHTHTDVLIRILRTPHRGEVISNIAYKICGVMSRYSYSEICIFWHIHPVEQFITSRHNSLLIGIIKQYRVCLVLRELNFVCAFGFCACNLVC